MNCPIKDENNADVLLAYCARKLDAESVAILERHMTVCPDCERFREAQALVWNALDAWEARPVSADFDRRLYARIEAEEAAPWYRKLISPFVWRPAFPLAAAAALVVAGFVLDHRPAVGTPSETAAGSQVSITEVEQVERTLDDMEMLRQFDSVAPADSKNGSKDSKTM